MKFKKEVKGKIVNVTLDNEVQAAAYKNAGWEPVIDAGTQSDRIRCPHCDKDYADADNLERHVAAKHPETLKGDDTNGDANGGDGGDANDAGD